MKKFIKTNALLLGGIIIIVVVSLEHLKNILVDLFKGSTEGIYKPQSESGATLTDLEAKSIAEGLYNAMGSFGTDEEKIYKLLKGISSANFSKVYNQFGQRLYWHELGVWTNDSVFSNDHSIDLFGWLNSELTSDEMSYLRLLAPDAFPK